MFKGAEVTPYNLSWALTPEYSPDKELKDYNTLSELRKRSRQLNRDNPVVAGFQQIYINMIISRGPTIYSASENKIQREQINKMLEEKMKLCDVTGTKSLAKILESVVSCSFVDGDILINLPMDEKIEGLPKTVIELIEAHRLQTPTSKQTSVMGSEELVRHGVEYEPSGKIKGYWVRRAENVDKSFAKDIDAFTFVDLWKSAEGLSRRTAFLFEAPLNPRPLASRQYPVPAPVIVLLKHMDDFAEAVIVGARVAACYSAFVETSNPAGAARSMTSEAMTESVGDGRKVSKLQPGSVFYLKLGEKITFASPNKPSDNTDSFILRNNKLISMYFRIPYILAFLDTEQVSYSSWRGAVNECYKMINRWRRDLSALIDLIVNTWVLEGIADGTIRGSLDTANIRKRWPAQGSADMEKEARGNKARLVNKTVSRQIICDEEGLDFDEVQQDLVEEALADLELEAIKLAEKKKLEKKYGIEFPEENPQQNRDTKKRPGEMDGSDTDEDDKKDRRKDDGNW